MTRAKEETAGSKRPLRSLRSARPLRGAAGEVASSLLVVLAGACAGDFPPAPRADLSPSWEPLAPQHDIYPSQEKAPVPDGGNRDTTSPTGCTSGEQPHGGHCYRVNTGIPMSYAEARANCSSSNGSVVALETKQEDDFVYGLLSSTTKGCWIGLIRNDGVWTWDGGAAPSYTNWAPGEPNNENNLEDCAVLWGPAITYDEMRAKWNDVPCHDPGRDTVVCERVP